MIDLIFAPNSRPEVVPEILERAEVLEIYAITMKVMSVADVLATKLLTLKEHEVDYESVLEIARSCREQIDGICCAPARKSRRTRRRSSPSPKSSGSLRCDARYRYAAFSAAISRRSASRRSAFRLEAGAHAPG